MKKIIYTVLTAALMFNLASCELIVNYNKNTTKTEQGSLDNGSDSTTGSKTDTGSSSTGDKTDTGSTSTGDKTDSGSTSTGDKTDTGSASNGEKTDASDSDNKNETEASSDKAYTVDCDVSTTDLAGWTNSVLIKASYFKNMVAGDYISITTASNNVSGENPQIQLCAWDNTDIDKTTKIGSDNSLSSCSYLGEWKCYDLASTDQVSKYTPSETELKLVKNNGFVIRGKGVKVTSVTVRVNSALDNQSSSENGESSGESGEPEETEEPEVIVPVDDGSDSEKARIAHDCKISAADLGYDWDWDGKVEIGASHFADLEYGDYIIITTEPSEEKVSGKTPQIKIGTLVNYNLSVVGSEKSCSNIKSYDAKYETYTLLSSTQTTRYTPSASEVELISKNGFVIQGQGVTVTKVVVYNVDYSAGNPNRTGDSAGSVTSTLSDPEATNNAKRLYNFIKANYGSKVITGQMENAWDNSFKQLDKVYADTGKYPGLMGFDFMNYTIDWAIESDFNVQTERAINFWNGKDYRGKKISDSTGIVTFCWHWKDPMKETTNESYKPEELNFRIPYDLENDSWKTTTDEYKAMMRDMDLIADELLRLQEAGVPVIWRPLHEGAGNAGVYNGGTAWFWWGAGASKSDATDVERCAEAYIALWKKMYTYYTETKKIHNLIWLWNGQNEKFYPGDAYVDMIGDDIYAKKDYSSHSDAFNRFQAVNTKLPVALSECGTVPTLENMKKDNAMWSFFMVWNDASNTSGGSDNFWNGDEHNTGSHKLELYNSTIAITLDDIGDLTAY